MDPNMHYIGIGISKHEKYQFVIVIILATHVEKKSYKEEYIRER